MLINLLGNALKFTRNGEVRVHITADHAERTGHALLLRFTMTDTGTGIDVDTQQRLFQPLQQVDATPGEPPIGSGLGLVICSLLVRALGGEITMTSVPGHGTCMRFAVLAQTLPANSDVSASIPVNVALKALRARHLMVVEDNDVNRKLLSIMLEQLGNSLFAVTDGEAAIAACETTAFDAILMDLNLPRIGGIEATRSILNDPTARHKHPAIIAMTASASASEADGALCAAAGMRGFLTKPATVFSLDVALRAAVNDVSGDLARLALADLLDEDTLAALAELDQAARRRRFWGNS